MLSNNVCRYYNLNTESDVYDTNKNKHSAVYVCVMKDFFEALMCD